uniref:Uncharacterized protein n=1 Tax=Acrobeloides nanus TaxID=290746 RepID=A0A914EIE6_9BILA
MCGLVVLHFNTRPTIWMFQLKDQPGSINSNCSHSLTLSRQKIIIAVIRSLDGCKDFLLLHSDPRKREVDPVGGG